MKRRLYKLVLILLIGAIINVSVCWIFATRPIIRTVLEFEDGHSDIGEFGYWRIYHDESFGRVRVNSQWIYEWAGSLYVRGGLPPAREFVPNWSSKIENFEPSKINSANVVAEATGWPLLAMIAHYERGPYIQNVSGGYSSPILAPNGLVISDSTEKEGRILPLHPIWPGFAINSIFYSAILRLLFLSPFTVRRIIRRNRGLCIKCGYDLRGNKGGSGGDVSPECGIAVSPATAANG